MYKNKQLRLQKHQGQIDSDFNVPILGCSICSIVFMKLPQYLFRCLQNFAALKAGSDLVISGRPPYLRSIGGEGKSCCARGAPESCVHGFTRFLL